MKYFRMSYEEVVFNRSYINIMLLNRSIPSYGDKKENEGGSKVERKSAQGDSEFFMGFM